jgi:hypothetical protein
VQASIKTRYGSASGGTEDLVPIALVLIGAYFFMTRQVLPDALNTARAAGAGAAAAINSALNKGAQIVTGDPLATVGTAAYNLTHPNDNAGAVASAPTYIYTVQPGYSTDIGQDVPIPTPDQSQQASDLIMSGG